MKCDRTFLRGERHSYCSPRVYFEVRPMNPSTVRLKNSGCSQ